MTLAHPALPPLRRWLSLRTLLMLLFLSAALYGGALPVYLFFRVGSAAVTLARGTQTIVTPVVEMRQRGAAAEDALRLVRRALTSRSAPGRVSRDSIPML